MEFYKFKGKTTQEPNKTSMLPHHKKRIIQIIVISIILITLIVVAIVYAKNEAFRKWMDITIFRKEITNEDIPVIQIDSENNPYIYAYDNYIITLQKNELKAYNQYGRQEFALDISVSRPIFDSQNRFLAVAEYYGKRIYMISGKEIIWEKEVEGEISRVNVNKNGYVSIAITQTINKTVIITYSPEGKELFFTFLATTHGVDMEISEDNKYLAIAEINSSGTLIQSSIKIIGIEEVQGNADNAIVYAYSADSDELITSIKYQNKDTLLCMYDTGIKKISGNKSENYREFQDDTLFADVNLERHIVEVTKKSTGLFSAQGEVKIINTDTQGETVYVLENIPNSLKTYGDVIAINVGTEVHFIHTNGWLIKKYNSSQEIKDIVLSKNIAGIIYKDRIEIVSL